MSALPDSSEREGLAEAGRRLLLPVNLAKCPLDIFGLVQRWARTFDAEIVVLHVIEREADPREIRRANRCLQNLGWKYLRSWVGWEVRVRVGEPAQEILNEAAASGADLIMLPTFALPRWKRALGLGYGLTTRSLVSQSACGVFVVEVGKPSNCLRAWSKEGDLTSRAA